jgi:hypothetical protein
LSHERTPRQFAREIERITGEPAKVRSMWLYGLYLEISGSQYPLGSKPWDVLSPAEQESICRAIGRPDLIALLGLDASDED